MFNVRSFLDDGPADFDHLGCDTAKPLTASKMHQPGIEPGSFRWQRRITRPLMLMGNSKAERRILQVFAFKLPRRFEPDGRCSPSGTPPS